MDMLRLLLALTVTTSPPTVREYAIDSGHSILEFSIGFDITEAVH